MRLLLKIAGKTLEALGLLIFGVALFVSLGLTTSLKPAFARGLALLAIGMVLFALGCWMERKKG